MAESTEPTRDEREEKAWRAVEGAHCEREGVTRQSKHKAFAPLHLLVRMGDGLVTWCTTAPALSSGGHPDQKRCGTCMKLALEFLDTCGDDED